VVERDVAAVVEDAAAQRVGSPRQGAVRAVVLGQAALNYQVPEHHLRARIDNLKDPVLELAGVNNRLVRTG
jgi:hypothetical protein